MEHCIPEHRIRFANTFPYTCKSDHINGSDKIILKELAIKIMEFTKDYHDDDKGYEIAKEAY